MGCLQESLFKLEAEMKLELTLRDEEVQKRFNFESQLILNKILNAVEGIDADMEVELIQQESSQRSEKNMSIRLGPGMDLSLSKRWQC